MALLPSRAMRFALRMLLSMLLAAAAGVGVAQTVPPADAAARTAEGDWTVRGQTTWIQQYKPGFRSPYSGPNSLRGDRERSYSGTATLFLGARLWSGAEVYANPEVSLGLPLSNLTGLGGFTNGELARVSGRDPRLYRARLFLRQTIGLGGGRESVEEDDNQIATTRDVRRVVVTAGNFSVLDVFDDAAYAKDARTQFLNWSLVAPGAWDFPADSRGYTWGVAAEYVTPDWTLRGGRFAMPKQSNGLPIDARIFDNHGDALELERRHRWQDRHAGRVALIAFRNRARMGSFRDALADGAALGAPPDLATSRVARVKTGFALSADQALADGLGVFVRYSRADGKSETFAFTEIDRSLAAGVAIDGPRWGRARDTVGIALVRNAISADRANYLAAGGLGYFLGDGTLSRGGERILETYYRVALGRHLALTADYQRIANPGYNRDRGPVNVYGFRIHASF
jgi:hypothetical protein